MPLHLGIDSKNVCDKVGRLVGVGHKVNGHATDDVVVDGRVRGEDHIGNDAADIAAEFGRFRQQDRVNQARRNLLRGEGE